MQFHGIAQVFSAVLNSIKAFSSIMISRSHFVDFVLLFQSTVCDSFITFDMFPHSSDKSGISNITCR